MTSTEIQRVSLLDRAIAAWEAEQDREEATEREHEAAQRASAEQRLRGKLSDLLEIELADDAVTTEETADPDGESWPYIARATVDGITFTTSKTTSALAIVLPCAGDGCRAEVIRYVSDLADIGRHRISHQECGECYRQRMAEEGNIPLVEPTPDDYIAEVELAGGALAEATAEVQRLADGRAAEKSAAIIRLVGTENPETLKPHSASSAEKVVETDQQYLRYRVLEREAEIERIRAKAHYDAVKLKATLAVGLATIGGRDV